MDKVDKKIINLIQTSFPISARPFQDIGKKVGLSEKEVIDRISRMKKSRVIRRIGGNFDSRKLGFKSTLCAAKVPEDKVKAFNKIINSYHQVTHNYSREHDYNIWFTFIDESIESIQKSLEEISQKTGVKDILNLPAKRTFKIRVNFDI